MSLSLAAAIKARLESTATSWRPSAVSGCPVFRDDAPEAGQAHPYINVFEGLGLGPAVDINNVGVEMVQVDVWQTWKPKTSQDSAAGYDGLHKENPQLGPNVAKALHLAQFDTAPKRVFFSTVSNSVRLPDVDANLVHTAITLYVRRIL